MSVFGHSSTRACGSDVLWCRRRVGQYADFRQSVTTHESFFDDLLHTSVIVATRSTSEWPVTSVLGLRR